MLMALAVGRLASFITGDGWLGQVISLLLSAKLDIAFFLRLMVLI